MYEEKISTNFYDYRISKEGSHYICFSVILIDSVFTIGKNHYSQVLLEECKCIAIEKKIIKYITDYLKTSSDDSDKESSRKED